VVSEIESEDSYISSDPAILAAGGSDVPDIRVSAGYLHSALPSRISYTSSNGVSRKNFSLIRSNFEIECHRVYPNRKTIETGKVNRYILTPEELKENGIHIVIHKAAQPRIQAVL